MREIKFRAKRTDTGEWCYGVPVLSEEQDTLMITNEETVWEDFSTNMLGCTTRSVYPSTLGQFTGLRDVNGKEVYDGDYIEINYKHEALGEGFAVIPDQDCFCKGVVFFNDDTLAWSIRIKEAEEPMQCLVKENETDEWPLSFFSLEPDNISVLGNIYDNKDLIEE